VLIIYRKKLLGLFFEEGEYRAVDILPGEGGARVRERARHATRLQQIPQARLCLLRHFSNLETVLWIRIRIILETWIRIK
jgi:hypothetical protein